jgi:hypothetical protein
MIEVRSFGALPEVATGWSERPADVENQDWTLSRHLWLDFILTRSYTTGTAVIQRCGPLDFGSHCVVSPCAGAPFSRT